MKKISKVISSAYQKIIERTTNLILFLIGIALVVFTYKMILIYEQYQSVPDSLIMAVFAALGGECGIMGWIKTNKDKLMSRKWQLEDAAENKQSEVNNNDYV